MGFSSSRHRSAVLGRQVNPDSAAKVITSAKRGVSLEQRAHRTVMFQSRFCYSAPRSRRLRTPLGAPLLATLLRGTGLLRSLRKACASLFASPSTAESGVKPQLTTCESAKGL